MIACVETNKGLCPIRWVGAKGLKVAATTYCGDEVNVRDQGGVVQLPDTLLDGASFLAANPRGASPIIKICPTCDRALKDLIKTSTPPPTTAA